MIGGKSFVLGSKSRKGLSAKSIKIERKGMTHGRRELRGGGSMKRCKKHEGEHIHGCPGCMQERIEVLEADNADLRERVRELEAELASRDARWAETMEFMRETSENHVEPAVRRAFCEVRAYFMDRLSTPAEVVRVVVEHDHAMPFSVDGKAYDPRLEFVAGDVLYLVRGGE